MTRIFMSMDVSGFYKISRISVMVQGRDASRVETRHLGIALTSIIQINYIVTSQIATVNPSVPSMPSHLPAPLQRGQCQYGTSLAVSNKLGMTQRIPNLYYGLCIELRSPFWLPHGIKFWSSFHLFLGLEPHIM